ncbi:hypothetical protein GF327_01615 [Candidatus Woesearchaeota archaeon]|nr:hypothetical protein [Candidatus Woesearchaeota archaeon]
MDKLKYLLMVFIIALFLRISYCFIIKDSEPKNDMAIYDKLALNLVEGKGFGMNGAEGKSSYMAPGQAFFLAGIYSLFGHNIFIARLIMAFIGSLSCVIIYKLAKNLFGVGKLASLLLCFYPTAIIINGSLRSETPFIFLLLLLFYIISEKIYPIWIKSVLLGGLFGIAVFIRPVLQYFLIIYLIWEVLIRYKKEKKLNFVNPLIIVIIFLITLSPWIVRNYRVHGDFILVTTNSGINFYRGNYENATGRYESYMGLDKIFPGKSEIEKNKLGMKKGIENILNNPINFLELSAKKFMLFSSPDREILSYKNMGYFEKITLPLYLFFVLFFYFYFSGIVILTIFYFIYIENFKDTCNQKGLIILLILYYFGIHSVVISSATYHAPIIPFFIIFASRSLKDIKIGKISYSKKKNFLFFSVLLFIILIWLLNILVFDLDKINSLITKVLLKNG